MHDAASLQQGISLEGRTAVVTGAGSGIGQASAATLAAAGAKVFCADLLGDTAEATAAAIRALGGHAEGVAVNVAVRQEVDDLVGYPIAHLVGMSLGHRLTGELIILSRHV